MYLESGFNTGPRAAELTPIYIGTNTKVTCEKLNSSVCVNPVINKLHFYVNNVIGHNGAWNRE